MRQVSVNERGMALAVALFAIVIIGGLVAGAFFAGTQEQRVGENVRRGQQAFSASEGGAFEVIRGWNPQTINNRKWFPAESVHYADTLVPGGTAYYGGEVFKLNRNLYLVDITGSDRAGRYGGTAYAGARQRVGMLVRVKPIQVDVRAAMTTRGPTTINGQALVDGYTHVPPGWTNCDNLVDTAKAGLRHPNLSQVSATNGAAAIGSPPTLQDPSVGDSTFLKFGDVSYADVAARATITLSGGNYKTQPSVNANGVCNKADALNWGDGVSRNPAGACADYFPIIHITGSATINNVQGQGILLVDGDLAVQGSYEFFGIVIVKGTLKSAGGGTTDAHFWGGVLASNVALEAVKLTGKATLNYSKCAILSAVQNTGLVSLTRSRSWVQLF